jgi:predicted phage terminase large subunit-like protein
VTYVRRPTAGVGERERVELFRDPRTTENELLFPALFTEAVVTQAEKDLRGDFFGQHQQRPLPATGGTFKKAWWRFWKPDGTAQRNGDGSEKGIRPDGCYEGPARALPASFDRVVISLDANFKGNQAKGNDPVVFVVVGCKGADRFVLDRVRLFVGFTETLTAFRILVKQWPKAFKKLVEAKANGDAIIETLKTEIGGIVPVEPEGGKEARANAVSPQVESGNVYLPDGAPWLDEWVDEFSSFPKGAHDDQVDALSQALIELLVDNGAARFRALGAR